jgi:hypothetical protein
MKILVNVNFLKLLKIALTILCSVGIAISSGSEPLLKKKGFTMENSQASLIDDFSKADGISSLGTQWRMFTDRVMGGLSSASSGFEVIDGRRCLRLQGSVSLENNGGFVQVALPLELNGRFFNAGDFKGIRLWIRGNGENYHVHLRTDQTFRPWQYFGAEFPTSGKWEEVEIPFQKFKPENFNGQLNAEKLRRIGIVAIKKEFQVDIAVSRLEFYQ